MKWMAWSHADLKRCPVPYVREIVRAMAEEGRELQRARSEAERE